MPSITYNSNTLLTLSRVIDGNAKLTEYWQYAILQDAETFKDCMEKYDEAWGRLHNLCQQLIAEGYLECLYPNGEKPSCVVPFPCLVCPKLPCTCCGGASWWYRQLSENTGPGQWLCCRCHPKPKGGNDETV